MTAHHPDWREWLESLNAAGAEYVVVGGVALAEVDERAVSGMYGGVPTRFIAREDLIRNKRATRRPRDLADVAELDDGSGSA